MTGPVFVYTIERTELHSVVMGCEPEEEVVHDATFSTKELACHLAATLLPEEGVTLTVWEIPVFDSLEDSAAGSRLSRVLSPKEVAQAASEYKTD